MPKPWYAFKASAEAGAPDEISILDVIHAWYGVDAASFLREYKALKGAKVKLYINSLGGDVVQALTIFNGMRAAGKELEVHVLGMAASAASYIAMAGDKVVMPNNTCMLLHKPMNFGGGNADDHREIANELDKVESMLLPAYMSRFKGTEDELKALLQKEEVLTAAECLKYGFCDEVVDAVEVVASGDLDMLPPAARAVFEAAMKKPASAEPTAPTAADAERVCVEAGVPQFAAVLALDPSLTTMAALQAAARDVAEIVALCRVTGSADKAAGFVNARRTPEQARVELAKARADGDQHVDTAAPSKSLVPTPAKQFNPQALWGEIQQINGSKQ